MTSHKPVYRITDLAADERPRERLGKLGPQALSSAELLAILLRVGGTGDTPSQLSRHFWKNVPVSIGGAAVRWNLPGWRGHPSILNETGKLFLSSRCWAA